MTNQFLVTRKLAIVDDHLGRLRSRRPNSLAAFEADLLIHARHGVIGTELAASLAGTANLRNRIAHGYASVDAGRIWSELPAGMAAFEAFATAIAAFLARANAAKT